MFILKIKAKDSKEQKVRSQNTFSGKESLAENMKAGP
jgi:hypothetical protein